MVLTLPNGWHHPDAIFSDGHLSNDAVRIEDDVIVEIGSPPADARRLPGMLTPGFVDLQVNGGGGILFNTSPTRAGLEAIAAAHRKFGTSAVLATVITDKPDVLASAVDTVLGGLPNGIIGIHIEGPHISKAKRGTHSAEFIRPLDDVTITQVKQLRSANVPVMITLAPEAALPEQIDALANMGAVVSLGHTNADSDTIRTALAAGATAGTHLFNAMSQMTAREAGAVGALIGSDAYLGIIADGIHVAPEMLALAIRARPLPDRMLLVSDAMPTVGGPDHFDLYGKTIRVSDGRLVNSEGNLAGAHTTMDEGLDLLEALGVPIEARLRTATSNPSRLMGLPELDCLLGKSVNDVRWVRQS